jgi:2-keto-4-pentenoate hydratase/2-oxohepta-3-ene-1,7-dioic acid hydratase in catechol pathway
VICVADNFPKAAGTSAAPLVFLKDARGARGDGDVVRLPPSGDRYWGEPELGFVIGKRAYRVARERAGAFIDHYLIVNDVTREGPAGHDHHLMYSKAFDGSLVLGREAGRDFAAAKATARGYHNGVLLREGVLSARLLDDPTLVSWLSSWCVLEPGDIIVTGAPNRIRDRQYLAEGDEFVCEIDGIGTLTNRFTFRDEV